MIGVYLELTARCGGCGRNTPVSGIHERVACASCAQPIAIPFDFWRTMLEDVALPEAKLGEHKEIVMLLQGYKLVGGREDPQCANCHAPLPDEVAQLASRGFAMCPGCGAKIALRTPPPELADGLAGAELVIGENASPAAAARAPASGPITLHCANCRAPLKVDGSKRAVKCEYCSTDAFLPDDVWLRLHPTPGAARFYLCWSSPATVEAAMLRTFQWEWLDDVAIGRDGSLYCLGTPKRETGRLRGRIAWCMGPDLATRWVAPLGRHHDDHHRLVFDGHDRLLVWRRYEHSAELLSATNGALLGKLGGQAPSDATVHHMDLEYCTQLVADVDGTWLALIGDHLVRFAADGAGIATWPPRSGLFGKKPEKLGPIHRDGKPIAVEGAYVYELAHHATNTLSSYSQIAIGWDGCLYVETENGSALAKPGAWLAKIDREGRVLYKLSLPIRSCAVVGADAAGNAFVDGRRDGARTLLRISPDGKQVDVVAQDHLHGGVLGTENDRLVVAADGTLYCMRPNMSVRVLAPDGRLVRITEKAKAEDANAKKEQDETA
jgi:DNA-directed RNA polymerase subunit RPC12/RpoP